MKLALAVILVGLVLALMLFKERLHWGALLEREQRRGKRGSAPPDDSSPEA